MTERESRFQADKIAELLGCDFGIIAEDGSVIYCGLNSIPAGSIIKVPSEDESFACIEGETKMYFLRHSHETLGFIWFYLKENIDADEARRLLELVAYAYDSREENSKKKKRDFFRTLLLSGFSAVNADDLARYCQESNSETQGYTVMLMTVHGSQVIELATFEEFLEGIFPPAEGYITIPTDTEKISIICPLSAENTYEMLEENADLVKDTALAELMIAVDVSLGVHVNSLKLIDYAFKSADRAEMIGKTFELTEKCFVYDKLSLFRIVYGQPKENCLAYFKEVFGKQFVEDLTSRTKNNSTDEILKTIETFLQMDQNISETAKALFIHRNTLIYRLDKFNKLTGLDCTRFEDGMKVGMALLILKYYNKRFENNG